MGILDVHRRSIFDQYGLDDEDSFVSPLDVYLENTELDPLKRKKRRADPFISPTESSLDTPKLGMLATSKTGEPKEDWKARMDELYTPRTESTDRYNRLLEAFPERNKPGFLRKLVASGASLGNVRRRIPGGLEAADKVLYEPYTRDVTEWKEKAEPFSRAAQLENTANVNERQLASQILLNEREARKQEEVERRNRANEDIARNRLLLDRYRAEGYTFDTKGPTIKAMRTNPQTGQPETIDTGVRTGEMDERELILLQNQGRLDVAKAVTERTTANNWELRYDGRGFPYWVNPGLVVTDPTQKIIPGPGSPPTPEGPLTSGQQTGRPTPPVSPQQRQENEYMRARDIASDPLLAKYLDIDEENARYIDTYLPGLDWNATDNDRRLAREIKDYVEGRTNVKPNPRAGAPVLPQQTPPTQQPPTIPQQPVPPPLPQQPVTPPQPTPPRTQYPSSGAYGPGATPGATPETFQVRPPIGPAQPPREGLPSSPVYGPGATPQPKVMPPPVQQQQQQGITLDQVPPGYILVQKDGQTFAAPAQNRDALIMAGYAVVR